MCFPGRGAEAGRGESGPGAAGGDEGAGRTEEVAFRKQHPPSAQKQGWRTPRSQETDRFWQ